jgi:ATP-dependent Clp protease, protease subunit
MSNNHKESKDKMPSKMADRIEHTLLEARRIFISDAVDSGSASEIIRKLWFLELTNPGQPILFVINSPGGAIDSGFAIWDQVQMITSPVTTLVTGLAASMGSVLSLCASPGRRFATTHSRIMIHQPLLSGVIKGQATDLEIQAREMLKTHHGLIELYMKQTGKDFATIEKAMDRDTWMSAKEALEFGLLDGIVSSFSELEV